MNTDRIFQALQNVIADTTGVTTVTRRVKLWSDFTPAQKPAICIAQRDADYSRESEACPAVVTLSAELFVYVENKNMNKETVPAIQLNNILDNIQRALKPNMVTGLLTLGGLVSHCWTNGKQMFDAGDLDGDGVAVVRVEMLLPESV